MSRYFEAKPDTKQDVERKLKETELEVIRLETAVRKMKADLLANHEKYNNTLISMKKSGLNDAIKSINRKKSKIDHYKEKLKTFPSDDKGLAF